MMTTGRIALVVAVVSMVVLAVQWGPRARVGRAQPSRAVVGDTRDRAERSMQLAPSGSAAAGSAEHAPSPEIAAAPSRGSRDLAPAAGDGLVGCVVHGRVVDQDGRAIAVWSPNVSLTDAAGERRNARASPDGSWSLAGLAPGQWELRAGASGHRDHLATLALDARTPIVRRDIVLERAVTLCVHLDTPSGERLWDALKALDPATHSGTRPFPVATLAPPGAEIAEASHRDARRIGAGSFWDYGPLAETCAPGAIGVLELTCDLPVFVSLTHGARVIATQRVELGATEVTFVLDPTTLLGSRCTVRARLVAEDGTPLEGEAESDDGSRMYRVQSSGWNQEFPPGDHRILFFSRDRARVARDVTLVPGQTLDLGDVVLPPGLTVDGHLIDDVGRPRIGRLMIGRRENGRLRFEQSWEYETDASGYFKVHGLLPGEYVLRTVGDDEVASLARDDPPTVWVSGNVPVSTLGGSVTGCDVRLVEAGILVLQGTATLPADARCKLLDAQGDLLRWDALHTGSAPHFAVPPGAYTLVLCDEEWTELDRRAAEVGKGVTEVDLSR